MLQQLLPFIPQASTLAIIIALTGTVAGLVLWLAGARFSRSLIALLAVAIGAVLGLYLPDWTGWKIDGWATAVGGALIFGVLGYIMHRAWVGLALGTVLATCSALATIIIEKVPESWTPPFASPSDGIAGWIKASWHELPAEAQSMLPIVCAGAMVVGLALAILWPRIGMVLLYSLTGVLLLVGMGEASVKFLAPDLLKYIPARVLSQIIVLLGLVAFGALCQWRLAPGRKAKPQVQAS